jgi:tetratricopeptide (TPR) repeat protein
MFALSLGTCLATAEPKPPPAQRELQRVYDRAKGAHSEKEFTTVIDACHSAVNDNNSEDDRQYADELCAWALAKRAALRAASDNGVDAALADYEESIALHPRAGVFLARGTLYCDLGNWGRAADDYRAALRLDPNRAAAYRMTAWFMATCPEATFRDAKLAVESAQKAVEMDDPPDYRSLDALAAAQANAGDFEQAGETQQRAIAGAGQGVEDAALLADRLQLYRDSKPYRMPVSAATHARGQQPSPRVTR